MPDEEILNQERDAKLTELDPIGRSLRELAREDAPLQASDSVEAALLEAFRRPQSRRPRIWIGLAAAAALLIGISTALVWPDRSAPEQKAPASSAAQRTPVEIGTDYFPLRAGPVLDSGEIGRVMRVPVSRSSMARFGLTQSAVQGTGAIQADVLVGMDGTARAVRFIQ